MKDYGYKDFALEVLNVTSNPLLQKRSGILGSNRGSTKSFCPLPKLLGNPLARGCIRNRPVSVSFEKGNLLRAFI